MKFKERDSFVMNMFRKKTPPVYLFLIVGKPFSSPTDTHRPFSSTMTHLSDLSQRPMAKLTTSMGIILPIQRSASNYFPPILKTR